MIHSFLNRLPSKIQRVSAIALAVILNRDDGTGITEIISDRIKWSTLARVGRSHAVRLTVFAPLIGYIVLFNYQTIDIIILSDDFLDSIGVSVEYRDKYSLDSLYYTYFGLVFLGLGSILFAIFCPDVIKEALSAEEYSNKTEMDRSPVLAKSNLMFVLDSYFSHNRNVESDNIPHDPEYPNSLENDFYNLISEMFHDVDFKYGPHVVIGSGSSEVDRLAGEIENERNELYSRFYLPSGYPNIHEIAEAVWGNPKVIWEFTQPFRSLSSKYAKDIAFVQYTTYNYSRLNIRRYIFLFYTLGFVFISIPSISMFVRILFSVLRRLVS